MTDSQSHLAYQDEEFLASEEARPLRIISEYIAPLRRFKQERIYDTIVFFGSARLTSAGPLGRYYDEARELARLLTLWSKSQAVRGGHRYVICSHPVAASTGVTCAARAPRLLSNVGYRWAPLHKLCSRFSLRRKGF